MALFYLHYIFLKLYYSNYSCTTKNKWDRTLIISWIWYFINFFFHFTYFLSFLPLFGWCHPCSGHVLTHLYISDMQHAWRRAHAFCRISCMYWVLTRENRYHLFILSVPKKLINISLCWRSREFLRLGALMNIIKQLNTLRLPGTYLYPVKEF